MAEWGVKGGGFIATKEKLTFMNKDKDRAIARSGCLLFGIGEELLKKQKGLKSKPSEHPPMSTIG